MLHSPPTSFPAIFSHSPPFLLKHNSAPPRLPTVHHCAPVKPRLVAVGSPRFQSCRRCLECFLSPPLFFICHVLRAKINQTSWFLVFLGVACGLPTVSSRRWRGGSQRDKRQKQRYSLRLRDANTLRWQQIELELPILSWTRLLKFVCLVPQTHA